MQELRVGIIGYGRIGAEHAGWIGSCGSAVVAAVCDATPPRRQLARSRGFEAVDSIEELLRRDIDAVLVTTPTSMHFDHGMAALAAGKHLMIDKPVALNLRQTRELDSEATRRGRVFSVFHNRRWDVDFLTVKNAVASGVF